GQDPGAGVALRDPRPPSLRRRGRLPVVRPAGALPALVGGPAGRQGRPEERPRPSPVGFRGGGVSADPEWPGGEGLAAAPREEARPEEDVGHPGGQVGARGGPDAPSRPGVRRAAVLGAGGGGPSGFRFSVPRPREGEYRYAWYRLE